MCNNVVCQLKRYNVKQSVISTFVSIAPYFESLQSAQCGTCLTWSHSFACNPHVSLEVEWTILHLLPSWRASSLFGRCSFPVPLRVEDWVGLDSDRRNEGALTRHWMSSDVIYLWTYFQLFVKSDIIHTVNSVYTGCTIKNTAFGQILPVSPQMQRILKLHLHFFADKFSGCMYICSKFHYNLIKGNAKFHVLCLLSHISYLSKVCRICCKNIHV